MNNHAGWDSQGLCVLCGASSPAGECDPRAVIDELRAALTRASAELRHCYRAQRKIIGLPDNWKGVDVNLIGRAIQLLEGAVIK